MTTRRFPVLTWRDDAGNFTARLVEDEYDTGECFAGYAEAADQARLQLKEYLQWAYEKNAWLPDPDFNDPALMLFAVDVRPEYRVDERIYPGERTIRLHVPCVHGKQESGLLIGVLPTLPLRFYFYEASALKNLVTAYVQESLKGSTPAQFARLLGARDFALDEVVVYGSPRPRKRLFRPDVENLERVAEPIGDEASRKRIGRPLERETEVAELARRVVNEKASVILVGESGVGKTAVVARTAREVEKEIRARLRADDEEAFTHRFWLSSGARIISGMRYLGQWEERVEAVIRELSELDGVLCIENLLDLVKTGGEPNEGVASFLMPYLKRGEVRLIAEATSSELDACRRLLPGFADAFQTMKIEPLDRDKALSVLDTVADGMRTGKRIETSPEAPALVQRLFTRFLPYQPFPGKPVAFWRELYDRAAARKISEITPKFVIDEFANRTGLPETFIKDEIPLSVADVERVFLERVVGQAPACHVTARLVTTFKAGLNDPARPLGVLMFVGPTGVGKTELAKTLTHYLFGHGSDAADRLVRLDMSEYGVPGSAARLATKADGEPSDLVQRLRQQPFSVVLFDEIEKADPGVFDVMLSIFDEGRLTDTFGRTTFFRSAVVVLTSNLGAEDGASIGYGDAALPSYERAVRNFFRPELFNRIDEIVRFGALDRGMMMAIAEKELRQLGEREGLVKRNLSLRWEADVVEYLLANGFDARYGARKLQRTLEAAIMTPIAKRLVESPDLRNTEFQIGIENGHPRIVSAARP